MPPAVAPVTAGAAGQVEAAGLGLRCRFSPVVVPVLPVIPVHPEALVGPACSVVLLGQVVSGGLLLGPLGLVGVLGLVGLVGVLGLVGLGGLGLVVLVGAVGLGPGWGRGPRRWILRLLGGLP